MNLYLLKFNNYYNRMVKRRSSIDDYSDAVLQVFEEVNFNPNDGISTTQIVNYENDIPDYVIVTDRSSAIISRWFVIEAVRTRSKQFQMTLYRDVIADWWDDIVEAPMFIEKAMLSRNDPLIFNKEQMTYNQIKTNETLIKDTTKSAWIVGYFSKSPIPVENRTITVPSQDVVISGEYADLDSFPYKNDITAYPSDPTFRVDIDYTGGAKWSVGWDTEGNLKTPTVGLNPLPAIGTAKPSDSNVIQVNQFATNVQNALNSEPNINWGTALNDYLPCATKAFTANFIGANGNTYKIGNKYYRFFAVSENLGRKNTAIASSSALGNNMSYILQKANTSTQYIKAESIEWTEVKYHCLLEEYNLEAINFTLAENVVQCEDAPYNMFAIPYHRWLRDDPEGLYSDEVNCRRVAEAIQLKLGTYLLDLQLLPYCPFPEAYRLPNGALRTSRIPTSGTSWYQDFNMGDTYIGSILYCPKASFSFSLSGPAITVGSKAIDLKVSNECDVYRLCSPNYNGQFEFSAAKNYGVGGWNIDCTYKPYQPYIHVAPDFDGLYGKDFDDARGLICGGDFSLAQVSDAWTQYQIQNKNYQTMFNRQIENMEVQHKYQLIQETAGAMVGQGQGAAMGFMMGGIPGAIAGTALSTAGGMADIAINQALRQEALDYTKDQFGYQLGNIKALPDSITKVSAYNSNNKIFPVLEKYTCTEEEKQALISKIQYNGMSVGRIGTISEFPTDGESYIKGKLIRLTTIEDDFHVVNTIANELNKGVFV